jgi:hypothetical protein
MNWKNIVITILALTAVSKLLSVLCPTELLHLIDPVFKVPILYVVAMASIMEIILCVCLAFFFDYEKSLWSIFAFALAVLTYRALANLSGVHFCPCMGNIADWWPWLGRHESAIMTTVAIWMLLTSSLQIISKRKAA